jgi:rhodanese-related sulfurtransferase
MAIKELTPLQAHDILSNDPSAVYIDVRTEGEFANGHPRGAVNIPVAFPDPGRGMMVNSDFVRVVEANFPREKKIIVGCQAGPRSTSAANMLQQAGFQDVSNLLGGFGGMRDRTGNISAPGWAISGLPVSSDNGEDVSYHSLSAKAKP